MKRILFTAAISTALLWSACSGNQNKTQDDVVPKGMVALNLKTLGLPVRINVPDSTYYPTLDTMETASGVEIKLGNHFDVLVNFAGEEGADLSKQKALVEATDAGQSNFTVNDSTTLVWETKFGDLSMSHFYHIVKVGKDVFYVRDNNDNPDNQFKKEEIDKMLETAKSLRAIPETKAPDA